MPPKPEKFPLYYALEVPNKEGVDLTSTNMVKESTLPWSSPDNRKTASVRLTTNAKWTALQSKDEAQKISFQTYVQTLKDNSKRVYEGLQIGSACGCITDTYFAIYPDDEITVDGSTTDRKIIFFYMGGSDPKKRDLEITFKTLSTGQNVRTINVVDMEKKMDMEKNMERDKQAAKEERFLAKERAEQEANEERVERAERFLAKERDYQYNVRTGMKEMEKEMEKNNGSLGMSMGLLRSLFD